MAEPDLSHIHTTNKQHNATSGEEKWLEIWRLTDLQLTKTLF